MFNIDEINEEYNKEKSLDELADLIPQKMDLTEEDIKKIMETISNPPEPTEELIKEVKQFKESKDV